MSEEHSELGFWRTYVFSTDHKTIGIQYGITSLVFLFFGFSLMMMMRWQLAYPGQPIPFIGGLLGDTLVDRGAMLPDFYNQLGAMHGTIMVFMGIVPLAVGAFGNYVVPLQIGAPDMAFPRLNMMGYQAFVIGGLWNGVDAPPEEMDGGGENNLKTLKSRNGVTVRFDDRDLSGDDLG